MIQRYSIGINIEKCDDAEFILYTDHLTEIEKLQADIAALTKEIKRLKMSLCMETKLGGGKL